MAYYSRDVRTWLKNKANGIYYVQIPGQGGRWVSSGFTDKFEAVRWALSQANGDIEGETKFGVFSKSFFIPGFCDYVLTREQSGHEATQKHWQDTRALLVNYLLPKWGAYDLAAIRADEFHKWLLRLNGVGRNKGVSQSPIVPLSGKTKKQIRSIAIIILNWAVFKRKLLHNPLLAVPSISARPEKRKAFRPPELALMFPEKLETVWPDFDGIISNLHCPWGAFFLIARETGLRPQEVCALTWEDYRPARRAFIVSKAVDNKGELKGLKTAGKGIAKRAVGISERLAKVLQIGGEGLIFARPEGKPVRVDWAGKVFCRALDDLEKLTGGKFKREGRTLYSLRHTRNTELLSAGDKASYSDQCFKGQTPCAGFNI